MDNQYAPIHWTHWTRFLLIPLSLLLLVGALVKHGQGADPAPEPTARVVLSQTN